MNITWQEAKSLSLEIWDFFRKNPKCCQKRDLPNEVYDKICFMNGACPLCEYLNRECHRCPLYSCNDDYTQWYNSTDSKHRKKYANTIYKKIKKWNPQKVTFFAMIRKWIG